MIRPWQQNDRNQMLPMIRAFLSSQEKLGSEVLASPKNVWWFWDTGVRMAQDGEPCLLYEEKGKVLSYFQAGPLCGELELKGKILFGMGFYTLPSQTSKFIGVQLLRAVHEHAEKMGYDSGRCRMFLSNQRALELAFTGNAWPVEVTLSFTFGEPDLGLQKDKKVSYGLA